MKKVDKPIFTDKRNLEPEDFQGGLSDTLFQNPIIQNYIKERELRTESYSGYNVWGYLGSNSRTIELDRRVEAVLIEQGLDTESMAGFLISKAGRYFADALSYMPVIDAYHFIQGNKTKDNGKNRKR